MPTNANFINNNVGPIKFLKNFWNLFFWKWRHIFITIPEKIKDKRKNYMSLIFWVRKITSPSDFMKCTKNSHAHVWKNRAICEKCFCDYVSSIVRPQISWKENIRHSQLPHPVPLLQIMSFKTWRLAIFHQIRPFNKNWRRSRSDLTKMVLLFPP